MGLATGGRVRGDDGPVRPRGAAVWWVVAVGFAVAGAAAVLFRPLAPDLAHVATDLDRFSPSVLDAVRAYRQPRYLLAVAALAVTVLVPAGFVLTRWGQRLIALIASRLRRPLVTATGVAATIALATALAELPLLLWSGYLHERRWGFATAPLSSWLRDWAIGFAVVLVIAVVGAVVLVMFRRRWPGSWHLRLVAVGTALTGLLVLVYPLVVQPLLLPTGPLPEGEVRDAVSDVLRRAGEGELEILVGDASRRTTKVNAFVTGIGPSRQVVLFDTLLDLPPEQVAVVVAHELAHREHRDVPRAVLASATGLFLALVVLRRFLGPGGPGSVQDDARAVAVLALVVAVGQVVAAPVANWSSRRAEAAADHRALELTGAAPRMIEAQRGFVVRDLADPAPPWWVTALWGTHPTIDDRIEAAVGFARANGIALPTRADVIADEPPPPAPRGP